jgi:hypothetical protein
MVLMLLKFQHVSVYETVFKDYSMLKETSKLKISGYKSLIIITDYYLNIHWYKQHLM